MQISSNVQREIVSLLQQGYSIDSIIKVLSKQYKNIDFKKSDIVILAKKNNIKNIGSKDLSKTKIDLKTAQKMMPTLLENKSLVSEIRNKLIIVGICLLVLLGVIYFLTDIKVTLIVFGILVLLIGAAIGFSYFKFVKPNKIKKPKKSK